MTCLFCSDLNFHFQRLAGLKVKLLLPKKLNQDIDLFLALACSDMLFWVISFIQIFFNLIEMFLDILSYNY